MDITAVETAACYKELNTVEQGFRYEKDCLSKKERTTCIGNVNSGENPKRFNVKRARLRRRGAGIYFIFSSPSPQSQILKITRSQKKEFDPSTGSPRRCSGQAGQA